jgi:hypothetical protein
MARTKLEYHFICSYEGCKISFSRVMEPWQAAAREGENHFCCKSCQHKYMMGKDEDSFNCKTAQQFFLAQLKKGLALSAWQYAQDSGISVARALQSIEAMVEKGDIEVDESRSEGSPVPKYRLKASKLPALEIYSLMGKQPDIWKAVERAIRCP